MQDTIKKFVPRRKMKKLRKGCINISRETVVKLLPLLKFIQSFEWNFAKLQTGVADGQRVD